MAKGRVVGVGKCKKGGIVNNGIEKVDDALGDDGGIMGGTEELGTGRECGVEGSWG